MRELVRGCAVLLLLLVAGLCAPPLAAQSLQAELLLTQDDLDGPPASAPVLARVDAGARGRVARVVLPQRVGSYWLRLTTDAAIAPGEDTLLVLEGAQGLGPVTFYPPAAEPRVVRESGQGGSQLLRRGWVLSLPSGWPAASVAYLRVNGMTTQPLRLRLASAGEIAHGQRTHARYAIAAFTVLMLMAVAMLGIYVAFRDLLYLSYAGYLTAAGIHALLLSGDAGEIWGLANLAAYGATGNWAMATLAVALQLVFTWRFLELDRLLPRGAIAVKVLFWAHLALLATLLFGGARVHGWYYLVGNALLICTVPVLLAVAVLAWQRGATYASYYLLGWTPLFAVAALAASNQLGLVNAPWAERALPLAAVIESAVLALALSQHAANRHRIAVLAQQTLGRDPLTGALNREALEQMLESWHQLGSLGARSYGVLQLDLDRFGEINERYGRAVGDAVLQQALVRIRAVLRPDDTIARMPGDGFAVVTNCPPEDCHHLARRVADSFALRPFRIDGHEIAVSVSIGMASSQRGESVPALLARTAQALRSARGVGRNTVSMDLPGRESALIGEARESASSAF
ncbi:diguanylate cyclase [Lysobacter koreensis]|uniref:diguanylate cyclase n=1 Tax=Lysobacter koreensis TaxID=266122 RepID=A0ABW2YMX1_9GAMM